MRGDSLTARKETAMNRNRLLVYGMTLLGLLLPGLAWSAATPSAESGIARVWFGAFTNTLREGKVSHDMTALVLKREDSKLSGGVGPSIDRLAPIVDGSMSGDKISFRIEAAGIAFALRLSHGHLVGTAIGRGVNAALDLTPAPGLMPQTQLVAEITAADARNFAAYDNCNADQYRKSLSPDLEFYQDNQPVKNRQEIIDSLNYRCAEGIQLRRELDPSSLIINAAPPYCAIEAGLHRIYSKQPDGSEHLDATARFTLVWSKKSGTWRLLRAVSYDHR
jgi:ketosteroid isomerase-like protein